MDAESLDRILEEMFPGEPPYEAQQPYAQPPQQLLEEDGAEPPSNQKNLFYTHTILT